MRFEGEEVDDQDQSEDKYIPVLKNQEGEGDSQMEDNGDVI
jgi:hypothetical protein